MAKASDNQFPKVILTEQGSTPATPAAGDQKIFIDSSDHHLKRVDEADAVVDIEAGGGTGASMDEADPYGIHHRLSGSSADDDEFDTDTSASYTQVTPTGSVTWAVVNHAVSGLCSGQSANDLCAFLKAMTLADGEAFETNIQTISIQASYAMMGLVITDGTLTTSNAIAALVYNDSVNALVCQLWKGTLTNLSTNINTVTLGSAVRSPSYRIRLKRTSSTSFNWLISTSHGGQYSALGTSGGDPGFTPTHAGVCVSVWGGSNIVIASFDFIRHV